MLSCPLPWTESGGRKVLFVDLLGAPKESNDWDEDNSVLRERTSPAKVTGEDGADYGDEMC